MTSSLSETPPPHRDTQNYRVVDPNASLPRRSKSFKDQESQNTMAAVSHSKQLSTVTYVPPSPYQIAGRSLTHTHTHTQTTRIESFLSISAEIPSWLKGYVEAPYGTESDYVPVRVDSVCVSE